ncbi:hypothetical protein [Hwanghaeella sp.]|uniref:hypothetical protein n=1 Tax=Hwanghaeella sp. TaxID=2605943 RepID=UPI003CCB9336
MPIRYRIFSESQLLVTCYEGRVTERDLLDTYEEIYGLDQYQFCRVELVDARLKTETDYTMASFMKLNEMTIERFGADAEDLVTAVLAETTAHLGMANLYRAVTEVFGQEQVTTFNDLGAALDWLKVPKTEHQAVAEWLDRQICT